MSKTNTSGSISKEMTIDDIFTQFPHKSQKMAQRMTDWGLHCVGCGASTWETLEAGMLSHGYSEEEIGELVSQLNEILSEKLDLSTISMTKTAAEKYSQIVKAEGKEGWGLRFGIRAGGCSGYEYQLDYSEKALETDDVYTSHGVEVHVSKKLREKLLGCEIDYADGLQGAGFKISNPNAVSSCGCGKSQSY